MLSDLAEKKETSLTLKNRENRILQRVNSMLFNQKMPFFSLFTIDQNKKD